MLHHSIHIAYACYCYADMEDVPIAHHRRCRGGMDGNDCHRSGRGGGATVAVAFAFAFAGDDDDDDEDGGGDGWSVAICCTYRPT